MRLRNRWMVGGVSLLLTIVVLDRIILHRATTYLPATKTSVDAVFLVMVGGRVEYLRRVLDGFSKVDGIHRSLILLGLDRADDTDITQLIDQINFTRHILKPSFPYAAHLFPDRFPGDDPRDCIPDTTKEEAARRQCPNWKWYDKNGKFRDSRFVQMKHHFWWMLSHFYKDVMPTLDFNGFTIVIEDDLYPAPDCLHVLRLMQQSRWSLCPDCDLIKLALAHLNVAAFQSPMVFSQTTIDPFSPSGGALCFSRENLEQIFNCSHQFCNFDDYNFDFSLLHLSEKCFARPWKVLRPTVQRMFDIGACGFHRKERDCLHIANEVDRFLLTAKDRFFPEQLQAHATIAPQRRHTAVGYGSFGDPRDQELCRNMSQF